MKPIYILLFLLGFFSAAQAADLTLPEKYLGYWEPVSKTAADIALDIQPDGRIRQVVHSERRSIPDMPYRYITTNSDKNTDYILVQFPVSNGMTADIWQIHVEKEENKSITGKANYELYINSQNCAPPLAVFDTISPSALKAWIESECQFTAPLESDSLMVYVHRIKN